MTDSDRPNRRADRQDETADPPASPRGTRFVSVLRLLALSLLVIGFSGWAIDDGGTVSPDSPFTIAFGVGIACAIVSIYLGVFLANRGG